MADTFTRTFTFSADVPRWRQLFYDETGKCICNLHQSEAFPPLSAWVRCELPLADKARLVGGTEVNDEPI
jgi:hypothetical protein